MVLNMKNIVEDVWTSTLVECYRIFGGSCWLILQGKYLDAMKMEAEISFETFVLYFRLLHVYRLCKFLQYRPTLHFRRIFCKEVHNKLQKCVSLRVRIYWISRHKQRRVSRPPSWGMGWGWQILSVIKPATYCASLTDSCEHGDGSRAIKRRKYLE
jgi:hypothetical protein